MIWDGKDWVKKVSVIEETDVTGEYSLAEMFQWATNNSQSLVEEYTAYDRGDLCADIDRVLGDVIKRALHRYMPRDEAERLRQEYVGHFADEVIAYDKGNSHSPKEAGL